MISEIVGYGMDHPPGGTVSSGSGPGAMGKEEFLQLLVAQLRNQDPLSPMQAEEFAAQLAQFAQVEQLIELNANSEAGLEAIYALAQAQNHASATSVLGKEVLAAGDGLVVSEDVVPTVTVGVGGRGGDFSLVILDVSGAEVGREDLGFLTPGRHDLKLEHSAEGLAPGHYRYRLEGTDGDGVQVPVQTYTRALVHGVRYGPEGPKLIAAGVEIPLGSVVEVIQPLH